MVFPDLAVWLQSLSGPAVYLGIFAVSFVGSATIVLPIVPAIIIVAGLAAFLNPWLVGVAAGLGSALGEMTGYLLGRGGNYVSTPKYRKYFSRAERLMERYGAAVIIFVFAATPLPFDVIGILCGVIKYDVKKFLIANAAGKILKFTVISLAAFYGINWLMAEFTVILLAAFYGVGWLMAVFA